MSHPFSTEFELSSWLKGTSLDLAHFGWDANDEPSQHPYECSEASRKMVEEAHEIHQTLYGPPKKVRGNSYGAYLARKRKSASQGKQGHQAKKRIPSHSRNKQNPLRQTPPPNPNPPPRKKPPPPPLPTANQTPPTISQENPKPSPPIVPREKPKPRTTKKRSFLPKRTTKATQ